MKPFANDEIREIMRDIADNQLRPQAAEIDQTEDYPFQHAQALAAAGINSMTIPSSFGGRGQGFEGVCIAVEEAAKACGISGRIVVGTNMGAVPAVMTYGTESPKKRVADLVLAGDKPAICFSEPGAGSDAMGMKTRADKRGNGYVLNGVKHWITGAGITNYIWFWRRFGMVTPTLALAHF